MKATQSDPWQEFADSHAVGQLVYGRITKLVPFGAFVQVGDGIEGLVHISEMAVHHVDLPEQVVTPGEELWVKIIDIDLQRRRISLSIKQAAEGGEVSEEYREAFGEHAYDEEGNYIGFDYAEGEFTPETEAQAAWADFAEEVGTHVVPKDEHGNDIPQPEGGAPAEGEAAPAPRHPRLQRPRQQPWLRPPRRGSGRGAGSGAPGRRRLRVEPASRGGVCLRGAPRAGQHPGQRHGALGVVREEQHRVEELELEQRRPTVRASPPGRPWRRSWGPGGPLRPPGRGRPPRAAPASPWRPTSPGCRSGCRGARYPRRIIGSLCTAWLKAPPT